MTTSCRRSASPIDHWLFDGFFRETAAEIPRTIPRNAAVNRMPSTFPLLRESSSRSNESPILKFSGGSSIRNGESRCGFPRFRWESAIANTRREWLEADAQSPFDRPRGVDLPSQHPQNGRVAKIPERIGELG